MDETYPEFIARHGCKSSRELYIKYLTGGWNASAEDIQRFEYRYLNPELALAVALSNFSSPLGKR